MKDILDETSLERNLPHNFVQEMSKFPGGMALVDSFLRQNPWRINFYENNPKYVHAQNQLRELSKAV